ncbi:MAG: PEP-CTERM sorting domain-containing protein [Planctomycetota bacterium]|nr:PEP-CTERM sorting domain-containing protein [Planctomycetota bacterium]
MKSVSLLATGMTALVATSAFAGFDGFSVVDAGNIGGRDVYRVYANTSGGTYTFLNCFNHVTTSGSQADVLHNDFAGGSWNPNFTFLPDQVLNDSYATASGLAGAVADTALDPSFGAGAGSDIPHNAGWYDGSPGTANLMGSSMMVMQVALASGSTGYSANLTIGYKVDGTTTALFGYGSYSVGVPAPGAMALLGLAGFAGRRRR